MVLKSSGVKFGMVFSHRLTFSAVLKLESRIGYVLSMVF